MFNIDIAVVAGGAVGGIILAIIILFIIVLAACLIRYVHYVAFVQILYASYIRRRSIAKEKKSRAAAAIDDDCGQFRMKDKKLSTISSVQHSTAQDTSKIIIIIITVPIMYC